jgi:TonB-dependent starch-binding outer membrane protein SusC
MMKFYLIIRHVFIVGLLLTSLEGLAQQVQVTGKVTSSDDGSALPGVSVVEKNTTNGTVTDSEGAYSINLNGDVTLVFSFVGYATQEVVVTGRTVIDIVLQSDITALSEIVVVGYGQQEKRDVTGVVTAVDSKAFNKGAIVSADNLIIGKIAGVQISPGSGEPGVGSAIRIRGGTSINASNEPLYVIDGVPVASDGTAAGRNPLNFLNPNDIETFTVLKDASAAAIYGSRAANGVIMITTKKGKSGKPQLTYDGFFSAGTIAKRYEVFNADQFRAVVTAKAPGNLEFLGNANTDWQDQIYQTAIGYSHSLSLAGGSDNFTYRASLGHQEQEGIIKTSYTKRTNVAINLSQKFLNDDLTFTANIKGAQTEDRYNPGVVGSAIAYDPTQPVYDELSPFGGYNEWYDSLDGKRVPVFQATSNPVAELDLVKDIGTVFRALGNFQVDYKVRPVPGLRANINLGYDITRGQRKSFRPSYLKSQVSPDTGRITIQHPVKYNKLLEAYIAYERDLASIQSKLDLTAGYSWQEYYSENQGFDATRLTTDIYGYDNPRVAKQTIPFDPFPQNRFEPYGVNRLISFFGRVNFSHKDKYLLTATVRRDGSTRFGPLSRWGVFPSAALGWRVINENFMAGLGDVFSDLKLRVGYGITGNQDGIPNYSYIPSYSPSNQTAQYQFGNTFYGTVRPSGYDQSLQWEETASLNIGIDFGVLNNRLTGSVEFYQKNTSELLFKRAVPPGSNLTNQIISNIGKMKNSGVELTLDAVVIDKGDLRWNVSFNTSFNNNEIVALDGSDDPSFKGYPTGDISGGVGNKIQILKVGQPAYAFYAYKQKLDENGNPVSDNNGNATLADMYEDVDGNGSVDANDLRPYKQPSPKMLYGLTSMLNYKNFDFSFTIRGSTGNYVYNNVASNASFKRADDAFRPVNITTDVLKTNFFNPQYFSDYYIENASFLRMDNLTLGYSFKQLASSLNLRIYGTVQNAFVLTEYSGLDPEASVSGIDNNLYPRARTFVLGVGLGL